MNYVRCRSCGGSISKGNIKKKCRAGGFIAKCPFCGFINNIKCRHGDDTVKSVTTFLDRRCHERESDFV